MQDLTVTLIQTELIWEDIDRNISMFDNLIGGIQEKTDLVILPEMFSTGFTMNVRNMARPMDSMPVKWLRDKSADKGFDIMGSMIIEEDGKYFNRIIWTKPDGRFFTYDKRHLFRMAGEDKIYSGGTENIAIYLNGWKIRPFVCYDLRFPIWTRNINNAYDLAVFIASWPEKRRDAWRLLLQARAVENLSYVIGVNRVGKDGNEFTYSGDSSVIDPKGKILFHQDYDSVIHTETLSYTNMTVWRKAFPAWMDADKLSDIRG